MMVLVFLLLAIAMGIIIWTSKRLWGVAIFLIDLILALLVFWSYATDKINIQL